MGDDFGRGKGSERSVMSEEEKEEGLKIKNFSNFCGMEYKKVATVRILSTVID